MIWTTGHEELGPWLIYSAIICFILSIGCFCWPFLKELWRNYGPEPKSPLEIIFDPTNPGKRFWSVTSIIDKDGKAVPIWEYRVLIHNISSKTIKGVRATVETLGTRPMTQEFALFKITQERAMDLHPRDDKFIVVLRWWYPARQAGLPYGETFRELYGPLKIIVSAIDTSPATRTFQFDYEKEPMLSDL